jgi:hypothetical protein
LKGAPTVQLNGKSFKASTQVVDGQTAYFIPLGGKAAAKLAARYQNTQAAWKARLTSRNNLPEQACCRTQEL